MHTYKYYTQNLLSIHNLMYVILAAVYAIIIICRLFLAVGLGGIFPLAATKAGEDTSSAGNSDWEPNLVQHIPL